MHRSNSQVHISALPRIETFPRRKRARPSPAPPFSAILHEEKQVALRALQAERTRGMRPDRLAVAQPPQLLPLPPLRRAPAARESHTARRWARPGWAASRAPWRRCAHSRRTWSRTSLRHGR
eukprot:2176472-Pleurochrysis_carterae.AAC.4